jgi:hypothetical protein
MILQRAGGFTIAGSSSEECRFDRTLNPGILSDIHRGAALVGMLARTDYGESWLGFRPGIASDGPIAALEGTALRLAYGHYPKSGSCASRSRAQPVCCYDFQLLRRSPVG